MGEVELSVFIGLREGAIREKKSDDPGAIRPKTNKQTNNNKTKTPEGIERSAMKTRGESDFYRRKGHVTRCASTTTHF